MLLQGVVGNPATTANPDSSTPSALAGKGGELLVAPIFGESYALAYRGAVFHASTTPLGLAIPIYTSATPTVVLWNPSGSGKNLVLLAFSAVYASGTAAYSAIGLMREIGAGSDIATGATFAAFSSSGTTGGLIGAGSAGVARVSTAGTNTLTTAGTAARWFQTLFGINLEAQTGTAHGTLAGIQRFNGEVILPPGAAIWPAATLASVALYAQTISWAEVPV